MRNDFGDVLYVDTPYRPESGSFSKPRYTNADRHKVTQWYYCRDLFHGQLLNLNLFFFSHDSCKGHCIAYFMRKVEEILDVQPRSEFGPTQRKTIMWIEPSRWWTSRSMRRSLFTILLRSGSQYSVSKDNFEEALFSDIYAMSTKPAVERFMKGNTFYTGKKRGWHRQFNDSNLTQADIDSLLVKPEVS